MVASVSHEMLRPTSGEPDTYRILSNGKGQLHLTDAVEGWLVPGTNPFGLYFYMENVEVWANEFRGEIVGKRGPEDKPWGMYEFAISDPDQTLVRVGWPTRLRKSRPTAALHGHGKRAGGLRSSSSLDLKEAKGLLEELRS